MPLENDVKSEQMLVAISENGGSASTTEIREMTGLGNDAVNYRHRKLENEGYIDVDPPDVEQGALKAKVAHLTEQGRAYVGDMESGTDFEVEVPEVDPEEFYELKQQVSDLQATVESLESTVNRQSEDIDYWSRYMQQVGGRAEMHDRMMGIDYRRAFEHLELALDDITAVLEGNRSISGIRYKQLPPIREIDLSLPESWRTPDEHSYPGESEREEEWEQILEGGSDE